MSYCVWLEIDTGGEFPVPVGDATDMFDMTSNVAPMWRAAGCDLEDFYGCTAGEVAHRLRAAVDVMRSDPDRFKAMEPENGWGSYSGCVAFLVRLADWFEQHPRAMVVVHH